MIAGLCGTCVARPPSLARAVIIVQSDLKCRDLVFHAGAGDGNRTRMTSLEGWGSAIELRPRGAARVSDRTRLPWVAYRVRGPLTAPRRQ